MDVDVAAVGAALRRRREALGLTRYAVAKRSGVGGPYLRRLEEGEPSDVGLGVLVRLCVVLDTTPVAVLRAAGAGGLSPVETELGPVVGELDVWEREVLLGIGRVLLAVRRGRLSSDVEDVPGEPIAAYDEDVPRPDPWPLEEE